MLNGRKVISQHGRPLETYLNNRGARYMGQITSSIYGNRSYESVVRWGLVNGTSAGKRRDLYLGSLHSLSVSDNEPD